MFINSLILALSSSIDSLGIGITYGIKNTRISYMAKIVLFVISFLIRSALSMSDEQCTKTLNPSLTRRAAIALPIPCVEPVTSAVFINALPFRFRRD